eukprot:COSAG01_NODE_38840_length_484_cov_1.345455_1_plen_22_part_01
MHRACAQEQLRDACSAVAVPEP